MANLFRCGGGNPNLKWSNGWIQAKDANGNWFNMAKADSLPLEADNGVYLFRKGEGELAETFTLIGSSAAMKSVDNEYLVLEATGSTSGIPQTGLYSPTKYDVTNYSKLVFELWLDYTTNARFGVMVGSSQNKSVKLYSAITSANGWQAIAENESVLTTLEVDLSEITGENYINIIFSEGDSAKKTARAYIKNVKFE